MLLWGFPPIATCAPLGWGGGYLGITSQMLLAQPFCSERWEPTSPANRKVSDSHSTPPSCALWNLAVLPPLASMSLHEGVSRVFICSLWFSSSNHPVVVSPCCGENFPGHVIEFLCKYERTGNVFHIIYHWLHGGNVFSQILFQSSLRRSQTYVCFFNSGL